MKSRLLVLILTLVFALAGCGSRGNDVVIISAPSIPSSLALDGYVVENPSTLVLTSFQNTASVFAGINSLTGAEYRAFLGFPLTSIPSNALIDFAALDIIVRDVQPRTTSIPLRIELVSFSAPLQPNDFDRIILPPLAFTTATVPLASIGSPFLVNVTALMREAQRLGLTNFQVRILLDFGFVTDQLIEIDDTTANAPLLNVDYF
jgi:hypothetical protein